MSDIPDWALERVFKLTQGSAVAGRPPYRDVEAAFARYIAEHEEPPVDPFKEACREVGVGRTLGDELREALHRHGIELSRTPNESKDKNDG